MSHVNFNHLNASEFNSFIPEATKAANNQFFKTALVITGIALGIWIICDLSRSKKEARD